MNEVKDAGLHATGMSGRIEMRTPDDVPAMLALKSCGWGTKRIAAPGGGDLQPLTMATETTEQAMAARWQRCGSAASARRLPTASAGLIVRTRTARLTRRSRGFSQTIPNAAPAG
ncbi:MAG: hypothetical protein KJZ85_12105 [Rhodobacteraceae bacterium]|jgi:hypothetical protein|nr:hypothetical protein [Paracoccaceae bacterium]